MNHIELSGHFSSHSFSKRPTLKWLCIIDHAKHVFSRAGSLVTIVKKGDTTMIMKVASFKGLVIYKQRWAKVRQLHMTIKDITTWAQKTL